MKSNMMTADSHTPSGQGSQERWFSEMSWWTDAEARATLAPGHGREICPGNCSEHPLIQKDMLPLLRATDAGMPWGNFFWFEEEEERSKMSAAERAAVDAAEQAKLAAWDAETNKSCQAFKIQIVQECQAIRYAKKGKIAEPCKKLYSCCGGGAEGGVARPTTMAVSSECWRHEYTDPRTGEKKAPHSCNWLHPGEDGWHPEWNTNRTWKAPVAPVAPNRFADAAADAAAAAEEGFQPVRRPGQGQSRPQQGQGQRPPQHRSSGGTHQKRQRY